MTYVVCIISTDLCPDKPRGKIQWTEDEKNAVWRHLNKYLTLERTPGKKECESCIYSEKELNRRSWKDVKNFVYNSIVSKRRKTGIQKKPQKQ